MKSTKRALLTSGLCLMLTALMLMGRTFAWFTDSVVNEGNVMQTGKLDVRATGYRWDEGTNSWTVLHNLRETLITERDWEPGISNVAVVRASHLNSSPAGKGKKQITVGDNQNNLADAIWVHITPIVTAKGNISSVVDVDNLSYARQNILMENENVVSMSRVGEISGLEVTLGHEQEFDNQSVCLLCHRIWYVCRCWKPVPGWQYRDANWCDSHPGFCGIRNRRLWQQRL